MVNKVKSINLIFMLLTIFVLTSCQNNNQQANVDISTTQQSQSEASTQSSTLESTSSTEAPESTSSTETPEEPISEGSGKLGDYYLEIMDYEIKKDYEDKDSIVVTYKFTNNSEENATFLVKILGKAFQDGVELSDAIIFGEENNSLKEIKTGASIEVKKAYVLNNLESPVEIEAKRALSLDKEKITKTFEISQPTE